MINIAVSSYSFEGAIRDKRMTLLDVIPKAKEMGFEGVEIVCLGHDSSHIRAIAGQLREQSKACGVPIVSYMTSADFLADDLQGQIDKMKKEAELCALLGASKMRHDACWQIPEGLTFADALPTIVAGYRAVTEYAAGLGVHTMIENHGFFTQASDRVKAIIEGVDHRNFGWLVDMGNFLCVDEEPVDAVAVGLPYAVHIHAKDFHIRPKAWRAPEMGWFTTAGGNHLRGAMLGHGNVNLNKVFEMIKQSDYDGWIALEFEGVEDCLIAIPEGLKNLKAYLEA